METNHLPTADNSHLEPGYCCAEFDPASWENLELHFRDKRFVRAETRSMFHIPLDMGAVITRTWEAIKAAGAEEPEFVILSNDCSAWKGEHFFNVTNEVPGAENVTLSGDFITHVFEGPYQLVPKWMEEMRKLVGESGRKVGRQFFYYSSCPKCAKKRGKNYVVGIAEVV